MSMLKINNLDISYGDVQVVYDVSLNIKKGEVVSIIGSNGAGKSTMLKCISGLIQPGKGEISFNDKRIDNKTPNRIVESGVVHVPEGRRLFSLMTVKENLQVGAYNSEAYKERHQTMEEVFELLPRLYDRQNQLAITLSGGEQQMVAIGRGLMSKPKLLMLDEPSLGLAPLLIKEIFKTVKKIAEQGLTVLLVEQDVRHSLSISNRGYVLEHGRIAMEGKGEDLVDDPHIREAYLGL